MIGGQICHPGHLFPPLKDSKGSSSQQIELRAGVFKTQSTKMQSVFFSPNVVTSIFCREENHRSGYFRSSASHADSRRLEGLSQHCFCHQLLSQGWLYFYFGCIFIFRNCISYVVFVFNWFVFCILYLKAFPSAAFAINFFPRVSQQSHRVSQHILFCQIISPRHVHSHGGEGKASSS